MGRHDALTDWMRTLRSDVGHRSTSVGALYASGPTTTSQMHRRLVVVALVVLAAAAPVRAQRQPPEDLAKTLAQVAQRVEAWYGRAQTVVATETVVIQPLGLNSTPSVIPRRLVFELRVGWEPDPDRPGGPLVASVLRQPISSGRAGANASSAIWLALRVAAFFGAANSALRAAATAV